MGSSDEEWQRRRDAQDALIGDTLCAHQDHKHRGYCDQGCGRWPCASALWADEMMQTLRW